MKNIPALLVGIIFLIFFSPPMSFSQNYQDTIRLTTGPWAPFTGEDLPYYGSAARIVTQAFAFEGVSVEYVFRPWKRAFYEAKKGEFEGSILWRRTPERERDFYYSDPVIIVEIVFFHRKDFLFDWGSLENLKEKKIRIGVVRGLEYEDEFDRAIKTGELAGDAVTTQEQNLRKLLAGRINITPIVKESGYATIRREFSSEEAVLFTHHPVSLAKHTLHLILSKKKSDKKRNMLELFNKGLQRLKKSQNRTYRVE